jgi:hypothetical protein
VIDPRWLWFTAEYYFRGFNIHALISAKGCQYGLPAVKNPDRINDDLLVWAA